MLGTLTTRVRGARSNADGQTALPGNSHIGSTNSSNSAAGGSAAATGAHSGSPDRVDNPLTRRVNAVFDVTKEHARLLADIARAAEKARISQQAANKDQRALNVLLQQYASRVRSNQQTIVTLSSGQRGLTAAEVKGRLQSDPAVAGAFDSDDDALQSVLLEESSGEDGVADVVRANEAVASSLESAARLSQQMIEGQQRWHAIIAESLTTPASSLLQTEIAEAKIQRKKFERSLSRYESSSTALKSAQTTKKANPKKIRDAQAERDKTHSDFLRDGDAAIRSLDFTNKAIEAFVIESMSAVIFGLAQFFQTGSTHVDRVSAVMQDYKDAARVLEKQREARRSRALVLGRRNTVRSLGLSIFGVSLADIIHRERRQIPIIVEVICSFLLQNAGTTEGVFRVNASINQVNDVKQELNQALDFDEMTRIVNHELKSRSNGRDGHVHLCAHLLKIFLRELPEPLLTHALYTRFIECWAPADNDLRVQQVKGVCEQLPTVNARTLVEILRVCSFLVEHTQHTKMTPSNLATVISPNLLAAKEQTADAQGMMKELEAGAGVVQLLIENAAEVCASLIAVCDRTPLHDEAGTKANKGWNTARPKAAPALPPKRKSVLSSDTLNIETAAKEGPASQETSPTIVKQPLPAGDNLVDVIDDSVGTLCEQMYLLVRAMFEGDDPYVRLTAEAMSQSIIVPDLASRIRDLAVAIKDVCSSLQQSIDPEFRGIASTLKDDMSTVIKSFQAFAASDDATAKVEAVRVLNQDVCALVRANANVVTQLMATHRRLAADEVHRVIQVIVKHTASVLRALMGPDATDAAALCDEIEQMVENDLRASVRLAVMSLPTNSAVQIRIREEAADLEKVAKVWVRSLKLREDFPGFGDDALGPFLAAKAKTLVQAFKAFSDSLREARNAGSFDVELTPSQIAAESLKFIDQACEVCHAEMKQPLQALRMACVASSETPTFRSLGDITHSAMQCDEVISQAAGKYPAQHAQMTDVAARYCAALRLRACMNFIDVMNDVSELPLDGPLILSITSLIAQAGQL